MQNGLEAGGHGKHQDNSERLAEANDIIITAAVVEEHVLKGARNAGDKQEERCAEVVDGERSGVANDIIVAAVSEEVVLRGARDAGDEQKERWAEVVDDCGKDDCSTTCDEKNARADGSEEKLPRGTRS